MKRLARARGKRKTGMNKLERRVHDLLACKLHTGEILEFGFEMIKLKLADGTFYTPDFHVIRLDETFELIEVKARWKSGKVHWEDDARVKIKVAAVNFPYFVFACWAPAVDTKEIEEVESWNRE